MPFSQLGTRRRVSGGGGSKLSLIGRKFMARKSDAAMGRGAPGCFLWNSAMASLAWLTWSSGSHVLLLSGYPFHLT